MATSAFFWNRLAKGYAKLPVTDESAYRHKLEVTRTYLKPDSEVMEFGCGTGTTAVSHAPFVRHVHGYDISGKMLEIARSRAVAAGVSNVTFERADIIDLDLPDGRFDVVMGHSILHLLRPKARTATLAKVRRLLRPGGVFVSSTICIGEMGGTAKAMMAVMRSLPLLPPVQALIRDRLRSEITSAGFGLEHDWAPDPKAALFLVARRT
jgi:ubiquinone/menaquinone biosynthesis C-methylase UbiE